MLGKDEPVSTHIVTVVFSDQLMVGLAKQEVSLANTFLHYRRRSRAWPRNRIHQDDATTSVGC